jgi:ABC-type cobalamin/Fe3+-siderophores transport system ATPase subunit
MPFQAVPDLPERSIILDIRLPRVVLINNGRVVVQGPPHEVITEGNLSSLHGIDVVVLTVNGLRVIMPRVCVS